MLRQFENSNAWEKKTVTISPHAVETINYKDSTPNIFVVQNSNDAVLKISIDSIPRSDSYEFKVETNTTESIGRPTTTRYLYILNDSSINAKITVFSMKGNFDPAILKNFNIILNDLKVTVASEIGGVAAGVTLPTQDRYTGQIDGKLTAINQVTLNNLTKLPDIKTKLSDIYDDLLSPTRITNKTVLYDLLTALNNIAQNTENIVISADSLTVLSGPVPIDRVSKNNAIGSNIYPTYIYEPGPDDPEIESYDDMIRGIPTDKKLRFHIDFFSNDTDDVLSFSLNWGTGYQAIFSVMAHETISNIDLIIDENTWLSISPNLDEKMYRLIATVYEA